MDVERKQLFGDVEIDEPFIGGVQQGGDEAVAPLKVLWSLQWRSGNPKALDGPDASYSRRIRQSPAIHTRCGCSRSGNTHRWVGRLQQTA